MFLERLFLADSTAGEIPAKLPLHLNIHLIGIGDLGLPVYQGGGKTQLPLSYAAYQVV